MGCSFTCFQCLWKPTTMPHRAPPPQKKISSPPLFLSSLFHLKRKKEPDRRSHTVDGGGIISQLLLYVRIPTFTFIFNGSSKRVHNLLRIQKCVWKTMDLTDLTLDLHTSISWPVYCCGSVWAYMGAFVHYN